jgi:hypothetical protein
LSSDIFLLHLLAIKKRDKHKKRDRTTPIGMAMYDWKRNSLLKIKSGYADHIL